MPPINLSRLAAGARVHHELRVVEREEKTARNGSPYVRITLGNRYGEIQLAPIWQEKFNWAEGAERGSIVQVIGEIRNYADGMRMRRQLELTAPLRLVDSTLVSIDDFLPRIEDDPVTLWAGIDKLRGEIASARLRKVVGLFFDDDMYRVQFERAPGSTQGHHAKIGGLLRHVAEVVYIARTIASSMKTGTHQPANLDVVTAGALLHDVGKVEAYRVSPAGFEHTVCGHLLGHVVLGCLMLERRLSAVGETVCSEQQLMEIEHLILSHHGALEYGSPVRPMTLEAEIVHWADEASAKASSMTDALGDTDLFASGREISDTVWHLDKRRLWQKPHVWD